MPKKKMKKIFVLDTSVLLYDYEAVKNCIHKNGKKSSKKILDQLIKLGDNWMDGKMNEDDITIVVIKKI